MTRILVAGELNVDLVVTGLPSLPVIGRELTCTDFHVVLGSSSAITAARLAALGAEVDFVGIVGKDEFGGVVLDELRRFGVGTGLIQQVDIKTGVTVALTYRADRALLTYPGTIAAYDGSNITPELLADYDHLHVGAYFLQTGLQAALPALFERAREVGLTTSLDVGWDPIEQWGSNPTLMPTLAQTDFFFPNESEAAALTGPDLRIESLLAQVGGWLVVKQGAQGATAYGKMGESMSAPALPVDVVDTTGAGDAFNAGFIYAHRVAGRTIADALRFAAACGAQAVTQVGGATGAPTAESIQRLIEQQPKVQA
ncbi:MAG: carbohydrate kinase family protein [Chloroflexi bacterium]|nr:carbohydrate kinase family protein [Chloroflexota bacterium]